MYRLMQRVCILSLAAAFPLGFAASGASAQTIYEWQGDAENPFDDYYWDRYANWDPPGTPWDPNDH